MAAALRLSRIGNELVGRERGRTVQAQRWAPNPKRWAVSVKFDPPLDLGLAIERAFAGGSAKAHAPAITGVDRWLERGYWLHAFEPARLRALLCDHLRLLLTSTPDPFARLRVSDEGVAILLNPGMNDPAGIRGAIDLASDLADGVDWQRHVVPAAHELRQHGNAWGAYATGRARLIGAPLGMWVQADGCVLYSYTRRVARRRHELEMRIEFPRPLGVRLVPRPLAWRIAKGARRRDGDGAFERLFRVESKTSADARDLLNGPVRAQLVAIADSVAVARIEHSRMVIYRKSLPSDVTAIPRAMDALGDVAEHIAEGLSARGCVGAYR